MSPISTMRRPWLGALIAVLAISVGASVPSMAAASPMAHHPALAGTTTNTSSPANSRAAGFGPSSPAGFARGALSTVELVVVRGGYVASAIGMRNLGRGTITIKGIPAGASVRSAILMWDILGVARRPIFAHGVFAGHRISGSFRAAGLSPCWTGTRHNFSFEADVTHFVTGNAHYTLSGFASGQTDGLDPFVSGSKLPMDEGATLIVIYHLASMPRVAIQVAQGAAESQASRLLRAMLSGFTLRRGGAVQTSYVVADGQVRGNKGGFNGHFLRNVGFPGAAPQAVPRYSHGDLWDTVTVRVTSLIRAGARSATVAVIAPKQRSLGGGSDCIVWVGQVLSVGVR